METLASGMHAGNDAVPWCSDMIRMRHREIDGIRPKRLRNAQRKIQWMRWLAVVTGAYYPSATNRVLRMYGIRLMMKLAMHAASVVKYTSHAVSM